MVAAPHTVVEAVVPRPPSAGVSLQEVALSGEAARWEAGVKWRPYTHGGTGGIYDPCDVSSLNAGTLLGEQTGDVYVVWEAESCSTFGGEADIAAERASNLLAATTSKRVARELWRGDVAVGATPDLANRRLNNPTAAGNLGKIGGGSAINRVAALAALEQSIGEQWSGEACYIHCTRRTASFWAADNLIHRVGNRLVTELGTVIIADAGYDGSVWNGSASAVPSAPGATAWAFATGPVRLWLSDIETQTANQANPPGVPDLNDPIAAGVDRSTNLLTVRAYRYAVATFDAALHVGVLVDHSNSGTNNAQTTA